MQEYNLHKFNFNIIKYQFYTMHVTILEIFKQLTSIC